MNIVDLFTRAGIYARDMDDWERKPPNKQTYYNLCPFIQAAYQRHQPRTVARYAAAPTTMGAETTS
jgi:hypothetical protein